MAANHLAGVILPRQREVCVRTGMDEVVKETEGEGEGDKGKGQGYLSRRDKGLPLNREETDRTHRMVVV